MKESENSSGASVKSGKWLEYGLICHDYWCDENDKVKIN